MDRAIVCQWQYTTHDAVAAGIDKKILKYFVNVVRDNLP